MKYKNDWVASTTSVSKINVQHAVNAEQVPSSELCPINLSNALDISNHSLIIRVWITLDRFTFRFAEALKKDGDFFSPASPPGLYTLRSYHLWTLVLVSWALNGSLRVVLHQLRSGRITAPTSLVRKRNCLPVIGTAWPRPFLQTKVLLENLNSLIRSVKRVLHYMLGSRRVTEEVLGITLCLVEQALN